MPVNLGTSRNDDKPAQGTKWPETPQARERPEGTELPRPPEPPGGRLSLFLDMDGVLAPIAPTPDAVLADPRRTEVIKQLVLALDGRVAIVSGRTLAEIDRISGQASPAAAGVHGLVRRRADGTQINMPASGGIALAALDIEAFAADRPGLLIENKGVAVGLHYRQAPEHETAILDLAARLAEQLDLVIQRGVLVAELKTPGADKGAAVSAFMAEPPFAGSIPIMLGDDLTDEDGFTAASALGGFGVLVGPPRPTAARYGLSDPDAVLNWLEQISATSQMDRDLT